MNEKDFINSVKTFRDAWDCIVDAITELQSNPRNPAAIEDFWVSWGIMLGVKAVWSMTFVDSCLSSEEVQLWNGLVGLTNNQVISLKETKTNPFLCLKLPSESLSPVIRSLDGEEWQTLTALYHDFAGQIPEEEQLIEC